MKVAGIAVRHSLKLRVKACFSLKCFPVYAGAYGKSAERKTEKGDVESDKETTSPCLIVLFISYDSVKNG